MMMLRALKQMCIFNLPQVNKINNIEIYGVMLLLLGNLTERRTSRDMGLCACLLGPVLIVLMRWEDQLTMSGIMPWLGLGQYKLRDGTVH